MELLTLLSFCAVLLLCLVLDLSVLYALGAGVVIFCLYGRRKGFSWPDLGRMLLSGASSAKNVVLIIGMMGVVAGLWRACGTIPLIICLACQVVTPATMVLMTFLMNSAVSMLMGSSFGVAATMGAISMTMAAALGVDPVLAGGAMLSGVYVGDRSSPVSSSALLVSELTHTDLYDNLRRCLRTGAAPFLCCCALYGLLGLRGGTGGDIPDLWAMFGREFSLRWPALIPAAVVVALSLKRVPTKKTVAVSILAAAWVAMLQQGMTPGQTLYTAVLGFQAADGEVGQLLNGGGLISMVKSMCIVTLSSSYSGIFRQTPLLSGIRQSLSRLAGRITPFGSMIVTALITGAIACNQTLTILMTHQLCSDTQPDDSRLAIHLENSAVLLPAFIPWSIAGAVPLASAGAPGSSLLAAFFLFLVPLFTLLEQVRQTRRSRA